VNPTQPGQKISLARRRAGATGRETSLHRAKPLRFSSGHPVDSCDLLRYSSEKYKPRPLRHMAATCWTDFEPSTHAGTEKGKLTGKGRKPVRGHDLSTSTFDACRIPGSGQSGYVTTSVAHGL
jgi:hypothetical protein